MRNRMSKWIVRDYWNGFRWGNIKNLEMAFWGPLVWGSWMAIFNSIFADLFDMVEEGIVYFGIMLPILFAYISHILHRIGLSKMMLICPLTVEEKREYVKRSIRFRFLLHFAIGIVGLVFVIVFGSPEWMLVLAVLMNLFFAAYYSCGRSNRYSERSNHHTMQGTMEIAAIMASFVFGFFYWDFISPGTYAAAGTKYVAFVVELAIQIPIFVRYQKYRKADIEEAGRYEGGHV